MKTTVLCDEHGNIIVTGAITGQFHSLGEGIDYLAFSEGTLLEVYKLPDGYWAISPTEFGRNTVFSMIDPESECNNCSDTITLDGEIEWVVFGIQTKKATF